MYKASVQKPQRSASFFAWFWVLMGDMAAVLAGSHRARMRVVRPKSIVRFGKWAISNIPWFWRWISSVSFLRTVTNRVFINAIANSTLPRPDPLSLWGPGESAGSGSTTYPSWPSLVDRKYTGRHLPPAPDEYTHSLPGIAKLRPLFGREGEMQPCPKSSALFAFFAQWFTDSFLRTDPDDFRKNTSNHEIDLCQIYGLDTNDTDLLRQRGEGKLAAQMIKQQEFPPYLFNPHSGAIDERFRRLSYIDFKTGDFRHDVSTSMQIPPERKRQFFASGLERGNSTILYTAINTVFLREHNRLCGLMKARYPAWTDGRLFETARNTN